MKQLRHLAVVSERYPVPGEPVFTFVDDLLVALNQMGVEITVISPASVSRALFRRGAHHPKKWVRQTGQGGFSVYQPRYLSVSRLSAGFNRAAYRRAVKKGLATAGVKPDAYYAHFWSSGTAAGLAAPEGPLFVACGESQVNASYACDVAAIRDALKGVICVSGKNQAECRTLYGLPESLTAVMPNGVDQTLFHPLADREKRRAALGLSPDDFVVAFVGWFSERKGVKRLEQALEGLPVKAIYIGSGDLVPQGGSIAFCGRVDHDEIPGLIGCADVFALPTQAEGCCNAIVEAMACGLPIISSDLPFNDDLLNEDNSIRIDPDSVSQIRAAVEALINNRARAKRMGEQAQKDAQALTVSGRAGRIKAYIEERL